MLIKKCLHCHKEFKTFPCRTGKYCSKQCLGLNRIKDDVSYRVLHKWVVRHLGRAFWCTWCFSCRNVQWANISHKYKRDLTDWISLCGKCHAKYDNWGVKSWAKRVDYPRNNGSFAKKIQLT